MNKQQRVCPSQFGRFSIVMTRVCFLQCVHVASILVVCCVLVSSLAGAAEDPILVIEPGGHKAPIKYLAFTNDGKYLASAAEDKTVRVWEVATGDLIQVFRGQVGEGLPGMIYTASLSPDNRLLALAGCIGTDGNQGDIRLLDFRTGEVVTLIKGFFNVINSLAFSPDGQKLIAGSFNRTARIFDVQSGETLHILEGHTDRIFAATFSPDSKLAVTGSDDRTVKIWDVESGVLLNTLEGHEHRVRFAAFTSGGDYLLTGSYDMTIRVWETKNWQVVNVLDYQHSRLRGGALSTDGKFLLTGHAGGSEERTNFVFAIPSGELITTFSEHDDPAFATAISPDNTLAATGGGSNNDIYIWELRTGKIKHKLSSEGQCVWSVGFANDGRGFAWGKIWERENLFAFGRLEQVFQLKEADGTFAPGMAGTLQQEQLFVRGIQAVGEWAIQTPTGVASSTLLILHQGEAAYVIKRGQGTGFEHESLTLTPDGNVIISGAEYGRLSTFETQTGAKIHEFVGHTGEVYALAVSPDHQFLLSGSADQTVKLWDLHTGKLLLTIFQGISGEWVAWIPEGYYISSLKGDRYIGWHINQGEGNAALYYPSARFARQFYSPSVVAAYLETRGNIEEAIRLANQRLEEERQVANLAAADILALVPPAVFFQIPTERDVTVSENYITIKAVAKSVNQEPITDIWVLHDGKRARGLKIGNDAQGPQVWKTIEGLRAELSAVIPLTQENNKISVVTANQYTQSEPETITVIWKPTEENQDAEMVKPDLYLLAIGVSEYEDESYTLGFADQDAQAIAQIFEQQQGKLYQNIKVRLLTNQEAMQDEVLDGLDWLLTEATQKDVAVLFLAGHGLKDERGNYYFLPYDSDTEKLRRTGVNWYDFQDVLTGLPSKVILIADTCHSGSITGKRRGDNDLTEALRDLINAENGVVVMTASTGKEYSIEKTEWGHGAFTLALIEGLEGKANYNNDTTIDIKELDLFVTNRVKELTGGSQHPTTEIPKTLPNFPIIYR